MENTIILNRICTGDYLDEGINLGHEVVNLFKPDNKDFYYVYLMADGAYPVGRRDDHVEAVYFTKGINSGCVEVVAVATGIEPVFRPENGFKCFIGGGGKNEIDYLFKELLSQEQLSEISRQFQISEIAELMDWLDTDRFLAMKPFADTKKPEMEAKTQALYALAKTVEKAGREKRLLDLGKAIRRRAEHIKQLCYIIENDVRYGGVRVNELFDQNTSEEYGLAIYLTYKAERIVKPEKHTYLVNDPALLATQRKGQPEHNILVQRKRLATTSLATYVQAGETENYSRLLTLSQEILATGTAIEPYRPISAENGEFTFLSIIKKEYDELVFSNMFQYFFMHEAYRPLIVEFLRSKGVSLSETFAVKREEAYIDLLITDAQNAVIIENKIKSGINGLELDEDGAVTGTQLERYREYVEDTYPDKQCYCFLFKPDYSAIMPEELKGYTPVPYSQLVEVFEKGMAIETDKATEVYFADFVKALKIHAKEVDNRYEEAIRRRMQTIIDGIR